MADIVSRIYANFRGVDFRGEEINLVRSPDSLNVWKDYKETDSIRTRPGMALQEAFSEPVYGIFFYKNQMLVHSGSKMYKVADGVKTELYAGMNEATSQSFVYDDPDNGKLMFYIKDGKNYLQYDGTTMQEIADCYIPTTSIGRKPKSGGSLYEDVNMLQPKRINTFLRDGEGVEFWLDSQNIDRDFAPVVEIISGNTGKWIPVTDKYTVNYDDGKIVFEKPPASDNGQLDSLTPGQDDLRVTFSKTIDRYKGCILKCTLLQVFDNRVFFSGNPDYPNFVWHSSLDDPGYCSDTDYYKEGIDTAAVRGLVAGNNVLWVFREPSDANTTVFYHTPTLDADYSKIYPSQHSSVTTGCIAKAVNFNDDIVFFSERGMEGISGDITTEQVVAHRSTMVDRKLISEKDYKNMILAEWNGYLCVFIGNLAYLADSRAMFSNENHYEYEWFYWEMEKEITCAKVRDGDLYLGTADGVYKLNDYKCDLESYWVTPKDKFKHPSKLKTTSKKSCTVEAEGKEISVFAKTDKDEEYELLASFAEVTDAFTCRFKKKKFKDLQIKFYSPRRFSLETATLDCYIGGYLKNL